MKLLLDIGNTSVNWSLAKDNQLIESGSFNYDVSVFIEQLEKHVEIKNRDDLSHILISNVAADEVLELLLNWVAKNERIKLWQASVNTNFEGLKNAYPDIRQMGVDRWLAMVAAWSKYKTDLCVVDCGTALTIDVIEQSGQHLGGYIIPGMELMQCSLIEKTERINVTIEKKMASGLADNTQEAISHGAYLAVISIVNRVVENMKDNLDNLPVCLITGGIAESIYRDFDFSFSYEPNLVLEGLLLSHNQLT